MHYQIQRVVDPMRSNISLVRTRLRRAAHLQRLRTKHDDKVSFLQTFETSELAARYINEHFAEAERNQFQIVCIDYKRFAEEWKVEHALGVELCIRLYPQSW